MCTYLRMCQLELLLNSMLVSMKTTMLLLLHLWYRVCLKECNSLFVRNFIFKMVETHAQCTLICSIHTSNFPNIPHQLLCSQASAQKRHACLACTRFCSAYIAISVMHKSHSHYLQPFFLMQFIFKWARKITNHRCEEVSVASAKNQQ